MSRFVEQRDIYDIRGFLLIYAKGLVFAVLVQYVGNVGVHGRLLITSALTNR
jgi:hypothetical protein